jgi:hypothetical protein
MRWLPKPTQKCRLPRRKSTFYNIGSRKDMKSTTPWYLGRTPNLLESTPHPFRRTPFSFGRAPHSFGRAPHSFGRATKASCTTLPDINSTPFTIGSGFGAVRSASRCVGSAPLSIGSALQASKRTPPELKRTILALRNTPFASGSPPKSNGRRILPPLSGMLCLKTSIESRQ